MDVTCSIMCYNYGQYLGRAIESCLHQRGHNLETEVLVIDDGSTDDTPEVCARYGDSIRVVRSEENKGFSASLTRSIECARGRYVCLLDADDYFADTKLQKIESFLRRGADLTVNTSYLIDGNGNRINSDIQGGGSTSNLCVLRRKALDLVPARNEIYFHALRHLGKCVEIDKPLSFYRVHEDSMTQTDAFWYDYLSSVTHTLADHLEEMASQPPSWTSQESLIDASRIYRTIATYDEMEAELLRGRHFKALQKCGKMFRHAVSTPDGIGVWHIKLAARCLQGRAIERRYH